MEPTTRSIHLKIRRYDLSAKPDVEEKFLNLSPNTTPSSVKAQIQELVGINEEKIIKIRNRDGILVPLTFLTDLSDDYFIIDITNISYVDKQCASLLQDAYVDAVRQKIRTLESRIAQSELLLPQLEWRRQAYMEDIVHGSLNKVAFLNRRFDELVPQYASKIPETMS